MGFRACAVGASSSVILSRFCHPEAAGRRISGDVPGMSREILRYAQDDRSPASQLPYSYLSAWMGLRREARMAG